MCYLWLVALPPGAEPETVEPQPIAAPKDAPYFYALDIDCRSAGERRLTVEGVPVHVHQQVLDGKVWAAECRYRLTDAFSDTAVARKRAVHAALRGSLAPAGSLDTVLFEGYAIILLRRVEPGPDAFIDAHAAPLAALLRSATKPLGQREAAKMLAARTRYSTGDLTVVDWEGAVIIADEGDFQSDIELLKIGTYQLLRYRLLDRVIDNHLRSLRKHLTSRRPGRLPRPPQTLQAIVEQRLALLLDFEKIDQSLLLIGDWYSARVYRLIVEQFYLADWKAAVSGKLDSLATIDGIVSQSLAFSWRRVLDTATLVGWLVLLVGYFALYIADLQSR